MPAAALAAFVAGAFALQQQQALPDLGLLVALALAAGGLAALALRARSRDDAVGRRAAVAVLIMAAGVIGFAYAGWQAHERLSMALAPADEGRDFELTGIVTGLPARMERGQRFEFQIEQARGAAATVPARLSLAWYSPQADVRPGERWSFTVRLRRPHGSFNPGGFDLEAWLFERNLRAGGYVREEPPPKRLAPMVWSAGTALDRLRADLRARLQSRVGNERFGGVLIALVLGDQRAIGEEDWLLFNRTGISHLVSISGLHITMVSALVALLAGALWRRSPRTLAIAPAQTAAAIAAVIVAFAYCLLAGWGVPAQRTFFMLLTVAVAACLRVGTRPSTTLALAAFVVCLLDPWAGIAPGFWLSFGAVAAILFTVAGRPQLDRRGWRARLREAGRIQLAVTVALVPLTAALFQQVSVVSVVANVVAIPVVSLLVTPLALIAGLFVVLPGPLGSLAVPCLAFAHALLALLHALLTVLGAPAWASMPVPAAPVWTLVLAMAGVAWMLAPPGWPVRWAGAVWLLPMALWPPERPSEGELWVSALDVGQGTAVLVESATHSVLYDTGPRFSGVADAGGRIVAPYLRWRGIDAIDLMVVSHLDSDHSGGAASILRMARVAAVMSSIPATHAALRGASSVQRCEAGQRVDLGALRIDVLRPLAADYEQLRLASNAASCVLRVALGQHRLLLTGDLPAREEAELVAREGDLKVQWISVPHHGSRSSSSDAFLDASRPAWASVQAGYRNRFGHPDAEVIGRYLARGVHVVRSDDSGMTQWRFRTDGKVDLHRWRASAHRYWHHRPDGGAVSPADANEEVEGDYSAEPASVWVETP
jgi:competence protein ComEC